MGTLCRFCFVDDDPSQLISPCKCSGTQQYVHAQCLLKWQKVAMERGAVTQAVRCSVCRARYTLQPSQWRRCQWGLVWLLHATVAWLGPVGLCLLWLGNHLPILLWSVWLPGAVDELEVGRALLHVGSGSHAGIFAESVVLLTAHSAYGSLGYIVNKPLSLPLSPPAHPTVNLSALFGVGGPVARGTHVAMLTGASASATSSSATQVIPGVHLQPFLESVAVEHVKQANASHEPQLKVLLGYAGWGPRQLDREVLAGRWQVTDLTPEDVFCTFAATCAALHTALSARVAPPPPPPPALPP
eukprot:GGOE01017891.1.p1 GENE.GGOE01017891.1~~GGOE01017891.1.p1  ORF type:complete len:311 (-),score=63.00 GGOE01017891.1:29-928(-)